jgi:hypothetical protein
MEPNPTTTNKNVHGLLLLIFCSITWVPQENNTGLYTVHSTCRDYGRTACNTYENLSVHGCMVDERFTEHCRAHNSDIQESLPGRRIGFNKSVKYVY